MIGARNALSTEEAAMRAITDNITMFAHDIRGIWSGAHLGIRLGHVADRRRALNLDGWELRPIVDIDSLPSLCPGRP
jgi:hypothetical protein